VGTLFTGAQRPARDARRMTTEKPLHSDLGVMSGQYASTGEGDDDGKTTATPKITFFANC